MLSSSPLHHTFLLSLLVFPFRVTRAPPSGGVLVAFVFILNSLYMLIVIKGRVMEAKIVNAFIKFCDAMQHAVGRLKESIMECDIETPIAPHKSGGCAHAAVTHKVTHAVVKCAHCGKEFERQRITQKYCSKECRLAALKPSRDAGCKEQVKKKRQLESSEKTCKVCGKTFIPKQARSQFCCRDCSVLWYNYQSFVKNHPDVSFETWKTTDFSRLRGKRKEVPTRTCLFCGKPYVPTTEEQKYCSKACKFEAHEKEKAERLAAQPAVVKQPVAAPQIVATPTKDDPRTFEIRECEVCHQKFQAAKGTNVRFCSQCLSHFGYAECVEIAKEEKQKREEEKNKSPYKVCSLCGTYFTDNTPTKAQIFCERCRQRQINKRKKRRK